jgi:hypothetical protein
MPIRRGAIKYWFKGLKYRTKKERTRQTRFFFIVFILVLALATVVSIRAISIGNEQRAAVERSLSTPDKPLKEVTEGGIWLTGDSVILGIRALLNEVAPVSLVNARIGRQAPELLEVMKRDKALAGTSPVIFNLGNNGLLSAEVVKEIFELVKSQTSVIVVNTAVPRPWRESNNALVSQTASRYSNVRVIDWNSISNGHPEYFAPDGVHLVPAGVAAYVAEIRKYL